MADDGERKPPAKRRQDGTFQPGCSGNPGGRHGSLREVREMSQQMSPEVLRRFFEIAMNPKTPPLAAVAAGKEILDRGYGRSPQTTLSVTADAADIDGGDIGDTSGLTALLVRARLAKAGKLDKPDRDRN
jgi:hypothetical protein